MRKSGILLIIFTFIYCGAAALCLAADKDKEAPAPAAVSREGQALTLSNCYNLALKQSETIAINKEVIKEAEARFLQAFGTFLPHVSFSSTQNFADIGIATSPKNTHENKFVFSQTLFAGFKEFAAMTGSKLERNQRANELKRAQQLLFGDVADAFYLLIEEREDLKILQSVKTVLINRIKFLRQREQLGRSRRSEVVTTEAGLLNVEAQIESIKSQVEVARHLLEFLTGVKVDKVEDSGNPLPGIKPEIFYISKAALRPDVLAAELALEVSKKNITVAKSGLLPSVSAGVDLFTDRNTAPQNSKWDATLSVQIPIFEGTETYGAIKQANAQATESQLQLRRIGRLVLQDIRDSYTRCQQASAQTTALGRALRAAEMSYYLQNEDYRLNLVNNLDVLQSIQNLEESRRKFIQSLYETKRLYWHLKISAGDPLAKEQ
jgi:outer membrane protein